MNDHHLPDDVSRWPSDPYALLGVSYDTPLREVKKAYARLIRRFRPEESPEPFRRIRDAFEAIQNYAKFSAAYPVEPSEEAPPPDDEDRSGSSPVPAEPSFEPPKSEESPFRSQAVRPDELAQLWDTACNGDHAAAYLRMREMYDSDPRETEVLLRLYWLLNVFPELDGRRHPYDWLTESLRASGLTAPSRELYRRVIETHPEEALSERCTRLLETQAPPVHLALLLEWRWRAAGRLGTVGVIERDLSVLGLTILKEDEATWVRLLLFAADETAWQMDDRAGEVFAYCRQYLEQLDHVQSTFGESYARLDFLEELSEEWKRMMQTKASSEGHHAQAWHDFLKLVPHTWTDPFPDLRSRIVQTYADNWADADVALAFFDEVQQRAPPLLAQLSRTLETQIFGWFDRPFHWPTDDEIDQRTRRFLATVNAANYSQFRHALRNFCFQEWLTPERMADVIVTRSNDSNVIELFTQVRNDWPLRCLCLAHQIVVG